MTKKEEIPDLESTQVALSKTMDDLNDLWARINKRLRALNLPIWASVEECGDGGEVTGLCWRKHSHEWQVCYRRYNEYSPEDSMYHKPIVDCTANERKYYLNLVKRLNDEMIKSACEFSEETKQEISEFCETYSM